ncbi:hypothetical protein WR25_19980 [Diploscapter pachys]|uniref:Alpha N-terminal protein methyltransferase 1 n=1 Tax=Diploscapter pachys TaxID=2018661 RepID=A0A2A2KV71_9BILA|nr:hypothetical protein WR25_19980 [Diploscapter pachys]
MTSNTHPPINCEQIYERAEEYWAHQSQDIDGMLGGFAHLHSPDIQVSKKFLSNLKQKNMLMNFGYALDCGAGIGRVTKNLLLPLFEKVDMVDVVPELINKSDEYIGEEPRIGDKFVEGLQTFSPQEGRYNLIWVQWVSGYLTDEDFIDFFKRCASAIRPGGVIVLKDNLTSGNKAEFDSEDNSWTRPEEILLDLLSKAGLRLVSRSLQTGFPKGMYRVKMFALKPQEESGNNENEEE